MRISILGAGAIGCYFAGQLQASGADVEVIARGVNLDAIRARGIRVTGHVEHDVKVQVALSTHARPADLLVSCTKAFALPALGPDIARILAPGGLWVCMVNGIPWWYGDQPLQSVDPGGLIRAAVSPTRTMGCVAYLRSTLLEPGVAEYTGGKGLVVGMPDRTMPPLLQATADIFTRAGIATTTTPDIRSAVWNKLFGNVVMNPLSAITGLSIEGLLADAELRRLLAEVIKEAMRVATAEGDKVETDVAQRLAYMVPLGAFRTSMLQDVDAGRPIELDAILGAMLEVAGRRAVDVPASRRLYAMVAAFARSRGLMPTANA